MSLFNFLGSRGVGCLEWQMLSISVIIWTFSVLMTMSTHKTTCTQFGKHIGYATRRCLWYEWDWFILFCPSKQNSSARRSLWAQMYLNKMSQFCSCCKYDKHWQIETCDYLQISTTKMLWKVVANILYVLVCKSNNLDDIRCIWQLDDGP